jgi:hypothetical protein
MATWQKLSFFDSAVESAAFDKLETAFSAWAASRPGAEVPHGSGVFSTLGGEPNQGLWYFSPDVHALGEAFNATPCEKPTPTRNFGLLVGESRSSMIHFAEYFESKPIR